MTAANAFARRDAAWLMFDTAVYDDGGVVQQIRSKVAVNEHLRLGVGTCGRFAFGSKDYLQAWLAEKASVAEVIRGLPDVVRTLSAADLIASFETPSLVEPGIRLSVAWYDDRTGGRAGVITDVTDLGIRPFTFLEVNNMFSPDMTSISWDGGEFDPVRDAVHLAMLQREYEEVPGKSRVGGQFEAYRFHSGGVDREVIVSWPDKIGRKLKSVGFLARARMALGRTRQDEACLPL